MLFLFSILTTILVFSGTGRAADFAGKTMTLITSMAAGGTNDTTARIIAREMPKYLPGRPIMIVQNMPGAGNILATNYMYNIAPRDGTFIAVVNYAIPLNQVLDGRGVRFDASKFNWLGSPANGAAAIIIHESAGVSSIADLLKTDVVIGGVGAGSSNVIWPYALKRVLGFRFKIVSGYKAGPDLWLAMERGEIQGRAGSYADLKASRSDWIVNKNVRIPVQLGALGDQELRDVPLTADITMGEEQRKVLEFIFSPIALGQPYLAPPGVPSSVVAVLRESFRRTMVDSEFRAASKAANIDVDPIGYVEISRVVEATISVDPEIVKIAKAAIAKDD